MSIYLSMITMILIWILKALGILVLSCLGIILVVLFLLLFVPIKYQVEASLEETLMGHEVKGRCSWLFRFVHVPFGIEKGEVDFKLKILGFTLYPKKVKQRKKKPNKTENKGISGNSSMDCHSDELSSSQAIIYENDRELDSIDSYNEEEYQTSSILAHKAKLLGDVNTIESDEIVSRPSIKFHKYNLLNELYKEGCDGFSEEYYENTGKLKNNYKKLITFIKPYIDRFRIIWKQFLHILGLPRTYYKKLRNTIKKLKWHFKQLCDMIKRALKGKETIIEFFGKERHKVSLAHLKKELLFIWNHSRPKKFKLSAKFGFEDPALTGKAMAALGVAMPLIGEYDLDIKPYFDEEIMELNGLIKGRIYLYHILLASVRVIKEKENRLTYKAITRLKF